MNLLGNFHKRAVVSIQKRFGLGLLLSLSAIFVGLFSGAITLVLKFCVHQLERFTNSFGSLSGPLGDSMPWLATIFRIISPAIGIGLTILFVVFVVRDDLGHGVSKVMASLSEGGEMPSHSPWSNIIACSFTVGFGGSVGMEAPIIAAGAGVGSLFAKTGGFDTRLKPILVGCGAAAAVAAVFRAPVAGAMIALEILLIDVSTSALLPLLISSVTGALLAMLVSAGRVEFSFTVTNGFNFAVLPWYLPLGGLCGLLSLFVMRMIRRIEQAAQKMGPLKAYIGSGGILCILAFLVAPLFGEGYDAMRALLSSVPDPGSLVGSTGVDLFEGGLLKPNPSSGWLFVIALMAVPFLKVIATGATTAAGGIGGLFAPSLVIGCTFGYACAAAGTLLGIGPASGGFPMQNFALAGMAGVLAGVMQAPLTAVFLIAEITNGYQLLMPLIITSAISFMTIRKFEKYSIYARPLALSGKLLTRRADVRAIRRLHIADFVREVPILSPESGIADVRAAAEHTSYGVLPVVQDGSIKGLVSLSSVRTALFTTESSVSAQDLSEPAKVVLTPSTTPEKVFDAFRISSSEALPFIDENGYRGLVYRRELLDAFRSEVAEVCGFDE